jgi:hypothetical protein
MISSERTFLTFLTPTDLQRNAGAARCSFAVEKRGISAGKVVYTGGVTVHRANQNLYHYVVCSDERVLALLRECDLRGYTFAMKLELAASAQVTARRYSITQEHIQDVAAAHLAACRHKAAERR